MNPIDKKGVRALMRARARAMDPEIRRLDSARIMERIEALAEFAAARTVGAYWPLEDEVDTREWIGRWNGRKRIVLPVVEGERMFFSELRPGESLGRGAFGICEPAAGLLVPPAGIDLVLVPGMAFSPRCGRLGRGKGYYDRYLAGTNIFKVGLCFDERMVDGLHCEAHDVRMDRVVTPVGVFVKSN